MVVSDVETPKYRIPVLKVFGVAVSRITTTTNDNIRQVALTPKLAKNNHDTFQIFLDKILWVASQGL
jgi:hypothetical protein